MGYDTCTTGKSPTPFSLLSFNKANIMNTLDSPSNDFFTCSAVKNFPPTSSTGLENVILLVKQLMLTPKDNIQSISKITPKCFNGKQTKSNSKSTLPKLTGHLARPQPTELLHQKIPPLPDPTHPKHHTSPPLRSNPPKRTEQHNKHRQYFHTCRLQTGKITWFWSGQDQHGSDTTL